MKEASKLHLSTFPFLPNVPPQIPSPLGHKLKGKFRVPLSEIVHASDLHSYVFNTNSSRIIPHFLASLLLQNI
jgi:hypothetical protein